MLADRAMKATSTCFRYKNIETYVAFKRYNSSKTVQICQLIVITPNICTIMYKAVESVYLHTIVDWLLSSILGSQHLAIFHLLSVTQHDYMSVYIYFYHLSMCYNSYKMLAVNYDKMIFLEN